MPDQSDSRRRSPAGTKLLAASRQADLRDFVIRVAVVAGAAAMLFLAWHARQALLLIFAAVVVAVIFDAASRPFCLWGRFPRRLGLASAALAISAALGLVGWLVGARVADQFGQLEAALRDAEPVIRGWLSAVQNGEGSSGESNGSGDAGGSLGPYVDWALSATSWGLGAIGALGSVVLVIVAGYFLAAEPWSYQRGMAMLFPRDHQERAEDALAQVADGLFMWLMGQLVSMTVVGVLVGLGTWFIGLPAPLALGLFAGLAGFLPVIGTIAGAVPALALAAAQDSSALLWTATLIVLVQQIESNMIMPMIGRHTVQIPPAMLLLNVFLFGAVFGGVGLIVAAPLTVAIFVLVKKLYVMDVLGHDVELPAD